MFISNAFPQHHIRIFYHSRYRRVMDYFFLISIETNDPSFDLEQTKSLLKDLGGHDITLIEH